MTRTHAEALLVPTLSLLDAHRHRILAVAAQQRLPTMWCLAVEITYC